MSPKVSPQGIESGYRALAASLESFGAGYQNVVKESLCTTDIEAMKAHNEVRKKVPWIRISSGHLGSDRPSLYGYRETGSGTHLPFALNFPG